MSVWVCVAALAILDRLDIVDRDTLGAWLSERQLPSGGLNGRPEKLEDVCYSWWDLASLSILGKLHWINRNKLIDFILSSQVSFTLLLAWQAQKLMFRTWRMVESETGREIGSMCFIPYSAWQVRLSLTLHPAALVAQADDQACRSSATPACRTSTRFTACQQISLGA